MTLSPFRGLLLLALALSSSADCGAEDAVCMLHKDISMVIKPPEPSSKGLSTRDKEYITDDQSGPFYDGEHPHQAAKQKDLTKPAEESLSSWAAAHGSTLTSLLILALVFTVLLLTIVVCLISGRGAGEAGVHKMSWGVFSQAISIFCAFLVFTALKDVLRTTGDKHLLQTAIVLLVDLLVLAHLQLFILRKWPLTLVATGMVYSYAISFAAVEVFQVCEKLGAWTAAYFWTTSAAVSIGTIVFVTVSTCMRDVIEVCLKDNERSRGIWRYCCCCCGDIDEMVNGASWTEWKKRVNKTEDQLAAVTIGYFISQAVEHGIQSLSASGHVGSLDLEWLAVATLVFAFMSMLIGLWTSSGLCSRFSLSILNVALMSTAWCLFHAAQWQYDEGFVGKSLGLQPKSFKSSFLVALTTSCIALTFYMIVCFYSLSFHTTSWSEAQLNSFQSFAAALGFILALPWVSCFTIGTLELLPHFTTFKIAATLPAAVALCVLVLPLWGAYVLPQTSIGKPADSSAGVASG